MLAGYWQLAETYGRRAGDADRNSAEYRESTKQRVERACANAPRATVIECATEEIESARDDRRSEHDLQAQQDMSEWAFWMFIVSALTMVLTAIALWFVKGTLDATRDAVADTGEATKAMQDANTLTRQADRRATFEGFARSHETREQLSQARRSADAALQSVAVSQDTARRQLRAYVGITAARVTNFSLGERPVFHLEFTNTGQTPAHDLHSFVFVQMDTGDPNHVKMSGRNDRPPSRCHLPAGKPSNSTTEWELELDARTLQAMETAGRVFVVAGFIAYRDVFLKRHITMFRTFVDLPSVKGGKGQLVNCAKGNRAN